MDKDDHNIITLSFIFVCIVMPRLLFSWHFASRSLVSLIITFTTSISISLCNYHNSFPFVFMPIFPSTLFIKICIYLVHLSISLLFPLSQFPYCYFRLSHYSLFHVFTISVYSYSYDFSFHFLSSPGFMIFPIFRGYRGGSWDKDNPYLVNRFLPNTYWRMKLHR